MLVDVVVRKDEEAADALLLTLPGLPVILFSAGESCDHGLRAVRNGASDYLDGSRLSGPVLLRSILYAIERKKGESALRQSERRYRQLLPSINSHTYSVEVAAGQAISTRHGPGCLATTGHAPADYEADPYRWFRMISPDDRPTVLQHLARLENGERVSPVEHRILHRDGTILRIRNSVIPSYDGSGHGLAPALLAAELQATLRTLVQTYRTPGKIITLANRILFPGMAEGSFITVLFTCFQPRDRAFSFISAGHPLPLILDLHGNLRDVRPASGLSIEVLEAATFASGTTILLHDGDIVLLWSDGMYEVAPPGGPMLGAEVLVDLVRQHLRRPAREIIEYLHDAVTAYGGPINPQDDMTIVILKVQAIDQ